MNRILSIVYQKYQVLYHKYPVESTPLHILLPKNQAVAYWENLFSFAAFRKMSKEKTITTRAPDRISINYNQDVLMSAAKHETYTQFIAAYIEK